MTTKRFDRLEEWLHWQEQCHPKDIDLGLARVREVAERLDLLRPSGKTVVTVAGTNGKGSCVATLEALLVGEGESVGAFSSPHMLHYGERIRLRGQPAGDDELCRAFAAIDRARGAISLTYFEFSALAALYLFRLHDLSYWLLEVGLGGRLDATNIIDADIAVITAIAIDHSEWLGYDRESIGAEKAGICRLHQRVICTDEQPPASVSATWETLQCRVWRIGRQFGYDERGFWVGSAQRFERAASLPPASVAGALQCYALLRGTAVLNKPSVEKLLGELRLPGRFELCRVGDREILLDVAHNPSAMALLVRRLQQQWPGRRWCALVSMMRDKDIAASLTSLAEVVEQWHLAEIPALPRAATAEQLQQALTGAAPVTPHDSVALALAHLLQLDDGGPIVVCGSFFTVAAAKQCLLQRQG